MISPKNPADGSLVVVKTAKNNHFFDMLLECMTHFPYFIASGVVSDLGVIVLHDSNPKFI